MAWQDTTYSGNEWVEDPNLEWGQFVEETATKDLSAIIGGHLPEDLSADIRGWQKSDLNAYLKSFIQAHSNISAQITPQYHLKNLPAEIDTHLPIDISGSIYGWQTKDLSGQLGIVFDKDLPASAGGHLPKEIPGIIKGWVREASNDLSVFVKSFTYEDLGSDIRATYLKDLPADLFPVQPKDLPGFIHGWQETDLLATITGIAWPWDLSASIVGRPWKTSDLSAYLKPEGYLGPYSNLTASINRVFPVDLPASIKISPPTDLPASINILGGTSDLPASIQPKRMNLTAILTMVTMEHKDLSATISIPCFYSDYKDLSSYINSIYKSDLSASIRAMGWGAGIADLGAKWGYDPNQVVQDKLALTVDIDPVGYKTEDLFNLKIELSKTSVNLGAYIFGNYKTTDLAASITGEELVPYNFDNWKFRERVYWKTYSQIFTDYEEIDVEFSDIVVDYIYSSGSNVVAKSNRYQHFLTKVSSYYSPAKSRRLDQRVHKAKILYDLRNFSSIDGAMKAAIEYVTSYPETNLRAYINAVGNYINLTANIIGETVVSMDKDLNASIDAQALPAYDVTLAFTENGIGYLQF